MSEQTPIIKQLLNRYRRFQEQHPSITQAQIANACNIGEGNFSQALAGKRGLSANSVLKLHKLLALPANQVMAKFHGPARSSQITHFQTLGKSMQLHNSGWTPGVGDRAQGTDPNDQTGNAIDNTPSADTEGGPVYWDQALIDVLRETRGYHRKAVRAINNYINQAKVNAGIAIPNSVSQKIATGNIARFATIDDVRDSDSVKDLITVIARLPDSVRKQVIALILQKFPNSH
jgi:hypothetical protein